MFRSRHIPNLTALLILTTAASVAALGAQEPSSAQTPAAEQKSGEQTDAKSPWLITVIHQINIAQLQKALAERGLKMTGEFENIKPINITTGIVIDQKGHVLTRLVN